MVDLWDCIDVLIEELKVGLPDDKSLARAFTIYGEAVERFDKRFVGLSERDRHQYAMNQVRKYYNEKDARWI